MISRFLFGGISSAINPLLYSVTADYFPPEKRSFANSVISSANYIGIAISSLTILIIKNFGWRMGYYMMGSLGLIGGTLSLLFIKEKS